jgi:adenosylcobinamide kinase/adenosylcobinamide-phosphate guanylyltransferase
MIPTGNNEEFLEDAGEMKTTTLITGGGRSGKSRHALRLAEAYAGKRIFIATAEPFDGEMRARIDSHKRERGEAFETIEEPLDLAGALRSVPGDAEVAVVDCLTVWLGNLMHHRGAEAEGLPEISEFLNILDEPPCDLIIVTNEVGMGIVPENEMARRFRDASGRLGQEVARRAGRVVLMVSGLPVFVKGEAL